VRATLLVIAALAVGLLVTACGGSSSGGQSTSVGGTQLTIPSDVEGVIPELEALLAQFPYQRWYKNCIVKTTSEELTPAEAEATESSQAANAEKIVAAAEASCKEASHRPLVDPNASEKELDLLRAGFKQSARAEAEKHGFEGAQLECIEAKVEELPSGKVLGLVNGTGPVRKGILLSVLAQCVKVK
jgi:hypothetical protein